MEQPQHKIDESSIFELDPGEIVITDTRPRQRKELGEISKMVDSIRAFGQLQPIVINRDNELIVGGRRLAACLMGGLKVRACYKDTVDATLMREMELEENVQRKALTPAEESLAVNELVELKQKLYGKPVQGRDGGFTLDDAAALVGKTKGYIIDAMNIAEAVKLFPELGKLESKSDIKKAFKGIERVQQQVNALASYEQTIKRTDQFVLVNRDAEGYLKGLGDHSIDLFFTDPPYAINVHSIAMTIGGKTGGEATTNPTYDDKPEYVLPLLEKLTVESYRTTKDTGHAYIFCAPSWFWWLKEKMNAAGWITHERPIVWIKRESGQNNQPEHWPSSAYEFVLFARKPNSRIIIQGKPDWLQVDPVLPSERLHQAEKPVLLCKELISRVCMPGSYVLDCCMGSGAIIEAAVSLKMLALGCEKAIESYAAAASRMTKWKEKNV